MAFVDVSKNYLMICQKDSADPDGTPCSTPSDLYLFAELRHSCLFCNGVCGHPCVCLSVCPNRLCVWPWTVNSKLFIHGSSLFQLRLDGIFTQSAKC